MFIVTGANGFIGSAFVQKLNSEGVDQIVCSDLVPLDQRNELLQNSRYLKFYSPEELMHKLTAKNFTNIRALFHFGACSDTTETNEIFLEKNNTKYTNDLFALCSQLQIPFFYASSAAVYGDGQLGFDDEKPSEDLRPLNLYGKSKLKSDLWIEAQSKNPPRWYGLRFFNVFGPNEYHKKEMRSLVHKAFEQIQATGQLKLFKSHREEYADGKQMRDFIYVKDVCDWIWTIYKGSNIKSGLYNMGYGRARTWLDLAGAVFSALDKKIKIEWVEIPENIRNQYQYYTEAKMKKLLRQGLPTPKWSLEDAVEDYVKKYLLTPKKYL